MKMNVISSMKLPSKMKRVYNKMEEDPQQYQIPEVMEPIARDKMIYHQPLQANIHHFYLYDSVGDAVEYLPLVKALGDAAPTDQFVIHINCWGGDVFSAIEIMTAIAQSEAPVIASIEGACASAATMIALACEGWSLSDFMCFMIHAPTMGRYGKFNELNASHDFDLIWTKNLFNKIYKDFLSEDEINQVLDGKDLWLGTEETLARLQKLGAAREAAAKLEEDECECEDHCCKKSAEPVKTKKKLVEEKVEPEEKQKRKSRVKPEFTSDMGFPVSFEPARTLMDRLNK